MAQAMPSQETLRSRTTPLLPPGLAHHPASAAPSLTEGSKLPGGRRVLEQSQPLRPQVQFRAAGEIGAMVTSARQQRGCDLGRLPHHGPPRAQLLLPAEQHRGEPGPRCPACHQTAQGEVVTHGMPRGQGGQLDLREPCGETGRKGKSCKLDGCKGATPVWYILQQHLLSQTRPTT